MRVITTHTTGPEDRQPLVIAGGNVGPGGAEQSYKIKYIIPGDFEGRPGVKQYQFLCVDFMGIDIPGVTNEALLAIVIDRLEGFQAGPFACTENAAALDHARICLGELKERTRSRIMRGVENTLNP